MKITAHWLKVAHERVRAGENEKEVLHDYGYVKEADYKRLRGLLKETLFYVGHAEYNLDLLIRIEKELEK
jgi:hypothetical protein